jgi:hypothetical protein
LLLAAAVGVFGGLASPAPVAAQTDGYYVAIRGSYTGIGSATVTATTLSITATVTDQSGNKGSLVASNLAIDSTGTHFSGSGTVLGTAMTVLGRLDAADAQGKVPKTARLMGIFTVNSSTHGRLAGYVPPPPAVASGDGSPPSASTGTPSTGPGAPSSGSTGGGSPPTTSPPVDAPPDYPRHRRHPDPDDHGQRDHVRPDGN